MINKSISTKSILAKILSDLNIQDENFRVLDSIEYIGEAIEKIGGFSIYNIKVTGKEGEPLLTVLNYQAKLPNDLYRLLGVAYSSTGKGTFIPLRYGTGTFDHRQPQNTVDTGIVPTASNDEVINLAMVLYSLDYADALVYVNANPSIKQELIGLLQVDSTAVNTTSSYTTDYTYVVNNSYIKLNVRTGYLMIAYQALPMDTEGYPLVPDDPGYIEAIYWYVVMKLFYPDWASGRITDRVYSHAESKWRFYAKQAYANAIMPNIDMLESLKNQWLKIVPEISDFDTFFSTLGQSQNIYNNN